MTVILFQGIKLLAFKGLGGGGVLTLFDTFQFYSTLRYQFVKVTDRDFTEFLTAIENCVSCLKSLGHEKELEFSFMAVTLENKLDDRMKKEFSIEYTSDVSPDKERMKSLLTYLVKQKKAAHMRSCNYKPQNTKAKEEDTSEEIKFSYACNGHG